MPSLAEMMRGAIAKGKAEAEESVPEKEEKPSLADALAPRPKPYQMSPKAKSAIDRLKASGEE